MKIYKTFYNIIATTALMCGVISPAFSASCPNVNLEKVEVAHFGKPFPLAKCSYKGGETLNVYCVNSTLLFGGGWASPGDGRWECSVAKGCDPSSKQFTQINSLLCNHNTGDSLGPERREGGIGEPLT